MIRHIVLFKLNETYVNESRALILNQIEKQAAKLPQAVAEIRHYNFVVDILHGNGSFDFGMIMDFDSIDDLNKYQVHEAHLEFVAFIRQHRQQRVSLDYNIE